MKKERCQTCKHPIDLSDIYTDFYYCIYCEKDFPYPPISNSLSKEEVKMQEIEHIQSMFVSPLRLAKEYYGLEKVKEALRCIYED